MKLCPFSSSLIRKESLEMARDAITGYVESFIEDGEAVPIEDDLTNRRF